MNLDLMSNQKARITVNATAQNQFTLARHPALLAGTPTWTFVEGGLDCTIQVDDDGMGAWVTAGLKPGITMFLVEADVAFGDEVSTIHEYILCNVTPVRADSLGLKADTPVEK